ncbi:MAG: undecaprenyldiphospho-muramoylpentapeptide beta-N-acetylglucosaminyltransferase [Defluviitaleaceae bacterium]|nr:undecaprenyldiphospho-muramoylpentapeptide beta-N-acetylglucosaminyltransferase [Defluviitaleaceae bacterium]
MKIVLTGGGTGGHVIPALALVPSLQAAGYQIHYIGSKNGIEKDLVKQENLPYHSISSGKLRRYIDKKNLSDIFRVIKGIGDAYSVLGKINPDVVFSKGGFVAVPVVIAAWLRGIPIIIHESDYSFGLANKIAALFAKVICVSFAETLNLNKKATLTGTPIRSHILHGSAKEGHQITGFTDEKPTVLVMGGSGGSVSINKIVRNALVELTCHFNVVHICGKGNIADINQKGYIQYEFVTDHLPHLYAMADVIMSRAGANALAEFLALKKPTLLVPLPKTASRGDQIQNAKSFADAGYSVVMEEEELTPQSLMATLQDIYNNGNQYITSMEKSSGIDGVGSIVSIITNLLP